ncbi:MAG: C4-dicarboxylate ABC transporter, partial [Mesorhizobium sp.]
MLNFRTKFVAAGALALSLGIGAVSAKAQEFINVLTGGTSGVYYP